MMVVDLQSELSHSYIYESFSQHFHQNTWAQGAKAYPIAKVRQSVDGASAVMGSKIVRADKCSDVDGSNNITLPCEFPVRLVRDLMLRRKWNNSPLTESNIPVLHPYGDPNFLVGCKPRHLTAS